MNTSGIFILLLVAMLSITVSHAKPTGDTPHPTWGEMPMTRPPTFVPPQTIPPMRTGGRGDSRPADQEIQNAVDSIRSDVEKEHGKLQEYVAESYEPQVVNGTNYYVKVRVAPGKFLEIAYHQPIGKKTVRFQRVKAL